MKKYLTKLYNIFLQIEELNGSTGWDQTNAFNYFYENNEVTSCWELLYGLFSENRNLQPKKFGIDLTLTQLRKLAYNKSCIYDDNLVAGERPILVATFERNGRHQISGTVEVEETDTSTEQIIEFIDGEKVDETNKKDPQLIEWEKEYLKGNDNDAKTKVALGWCLTLGGDVEWVQELKQLLISKNVDYNFFEKYLINIDELTSDEITDLEFVEDRLDTHLEDFEDFDLTGNVPTFKFYNQTPDTLYDLESISAFIFYLKDVCKLSFHPDNTFDDYINIETKQNLFTQEQIELYDKYLEDIFELDSNDDSIFVENGYEDIYDYTVYLYSDNVKNESNQEIDFISLSDENCVEIITNGLTIHYHDDNDQLIEVSTIFEYNDYVENYEDDRCFIFINNFKNDNRFVNKVINTEDDLLKYFPANDSWKSTTPAEILQYFTELKLDYQFDKNSADYLGFINIDPSDIDDRDMKGVVTYIVNNYDQSEKIANTVGLTIESADMEEFIVNELVIDDVNLGNMVEKTINYLQENKNRNAFSFYLIHSEPSLVLDVEKITTDINKIDEDSLLSYVRIEVVGTKWFFYEVFVFGFEYSEEVSTCTFNPKDNNFYDFVGEFVIRAELSSGHDIFNLLPFCIGYVKNYKFDIIAYQEDGNLNIGIKADTPIPTVVVEFDTDGESYFGYLTFEPGQDTFSEQEKYSLYNDLEISFNNDTKIWNLSSTDLVETISMFDEND